MEAKFKVRRDKTYIAWQPASGTFDGVPVTVRRGERVTGNHPLVRALGPGAFVEDGTPEVDWPSVFAEAGRNIAHNSQTPSSP